MEEKEDKKRGSPSSKMITSLDEKGGHKSSKRSQSSTEMSPVDESNEMSKNCPRLREIPLGYSKDLRSYGRSISPRKELPLAEESKGKHRAYVARDVSSPDEDYRTNKGSINPQETPSRRNSNGTQFLKISNKRDQSPDHERGYQLKHGSKSLGKNGGFPLHGGSMSSSYSWLYSSRREIFENLGGLFG